MMFPAITVRPTSIFDWSQHQRGRGKNLLAKDLTDQQGLVVKPKVWPAVLAAVNTIVCPLTKDIWDMVELLFFFLVP